MPDKEVYVKITKDGPYMVYGIKNIAQNIIITDENGVCIEYGVGKNFEIKTDPAAICRCGNTKNSPYCDGSHLSAEFDGKSTASFEPVLDGAVKYEGPNLVLIDKEELCGFARFCDARGSIWNLIYKGDEESDKQAIKEANLCPAGRLMMFDKEGNSLESPQEISVSLLEDKGLRISGPLWLRGGIRVENENGESYEVRNKQTLCRCGKSKNKPFCDSAHRHVKFKADYKKAD